jgi:hypothetical protein
MTSRQARRERREAERKAARLAYKAAQQAPAQPAPIDDEFSPELLAEAAAMRERIAQRVAINRANAAHSTGPVTPAGKLASSSNSLKHGLASGTLLIANEDPAAFESLLENLLADHQPANSTEELLVREMAQSWWITQRALSLQNECFNPEGVEEKRLALFLRYQTTHQRAFHKALAALLRLQRERRRENPGFVSQKRPQPSIDSGFVSQNPSQPAAPTPAAAPAPPENDQIMPLAA